MLKSFYELAVALLEISGTVVILIGSVVATWQFFRQGQRGGYSQAYHPFRTTLGRSILLGLEFLVAADILNSLVIAPSVEDLIVLVVLVLVRTFLSISLGVEINGHWPWQDTRLERERKATDRNPS